MFGDIELTADMLAEQMIMHTVKDYGTKADEVEAIKKQLVLLDLFNVYQWQAGKMRSEVGSNLNNDTAGAKKDISSNSEAVGKVITDDLEYDIVNNVYGNVDVIGKRTIVTAPRRAVRTAHKAISLFSLFNNTKEFPTVNKTFVELTEEIQADDRSRYMNS